MSAQQQITRTSRRYRILLTVIFFLIPVINGLVWGMIDHLPEYWHRWSFEISGDITPLMKVLGFLTAMIKGGIVMYGLRSLVHLFRLYETGIFFNPDTVTCFKNLSRAFIWWVIAGILTTPLTALILTMNNPPGQHVVQLGLESADITALISGGILRIIAGVMADGQRLREEQELTI